MIRKFIILLCFFCAVLCAIVGYLSMQVDEQSDKREGPATSFNCKDFLANEPDETARINLTDFKRGKHYSHADHDGDDLWDELYVPLFPNKKKIKFGYKAVIVSFKGVQNKEQLDEVLGNRELDATYWPERQDLPARTYSELAQKYKNMDFANCVNLHHGFPATNPLLGEMSLMISKYIGA